MLIESDDKAYIEALRELLFARGINCAVMALGADATGRAIHGIQVLDLQQEGKAHDLLLRDAEFLTDLGNLPYARKLLELRAHRLHLVGRLLTSRPAIWLAAMALGILALDLLRRLI